MNKFEINGPGFGSHSGMYWIIDRNSYNYLLSDGTVSNMDRYQQEQEKYWYKSKEEAGTFLYNFNKGKKLEFTIKSSTHCNEDGNEFRIYYIVTNNLVTYLHKDGVVRNGCLTDSLPKPKCPEKLSEHVVHGGWYETNKEAQRVLDEYNEKHKKKLTVEERLNRLEAKVGL